MILKIRVNIHEVQTLGSIKYSLSISRPLYLDPILLNKSSEIQTDYLGTHLLPRSSAMIEISICWTAELKSCLNSQFLQHCPVQFDFLFMVIKMGFEPERARIFRIFPKALLLTFSIIQLVCCGLALITEVIHIFLPVVQLQFYTLKWLFIKVS